MIMSDEKFTFTPPRTNESEGDILTPSGFQVGKVDIWTTSNEPLPLERQAELMTRKIVGLCEDNEPHIRMQAHAMRDRIKHLFEQYLRLARATDRAFIVDKLKSFGYKNAAEVVPPNTDPISRLPSGGVYMLDDWTVLLVNQLCVVSENAPSELFEQAQAFKTELTRVVFHYLKQARTSDRRYMAAGLDVKGFSEHAQAIRSM